MKTTARYHEQSVTPAYAGVQFHNLLDSGLRRNDPQR